MYVIARADQVLFTRHAVFARQVWMLGRMTKRKRGTPCAQCGGAIGAKAYIPITNLGNRMVRICEQCGEGRTHPAGRRKCNQHHQ